MMWRHISAPGTRGPRNKILREYNDPHVCSRIWRVGIMRQGSISFINYNYVQIDKEFQINITTMLCWWSLHNNYKPRCKYISLPYQRTLMCLFHEWEVCTSSLHKMKAKWRGTVRLRIHTKNYRVNLILVRIGPIFTTLKQMFKVSSEMGCLQGIAHTTKKIPH